MGRPAHAVGRVEPQVRLPRRALEPHRLSLVVDGLDVSLEVPNRVQKELPHVHQTGLGVDRWTPPCLLGQSTEVGRHLRAGGFDQCQVELEFTLGIVERLGIVPAVDADEEWALESDRALHAIGEELLAIGRVADDLLHTHLLCDRVGEELLCREALDRCPEKRRSRAIALDSSGTGVPSSTWVSSIWA